MSSGDIDIDSNDIESNKCSFLSSAKLFQYVIFAPDLALANANVLKLLQLSSPYVSINIPSYVSVRLKLAQSPSIIVTLDLPLAQAFNFSKIFGCISIIVWLFTPCFCI